MSTSRRASRARASSRRTPRGARPREAASSEPRDVLRQLGPGLITGAADDDPSGIATYSQAGAQFGYQLGWTVVLTYPLMVGIQLVSARIGRVTGRGLAANIARHFPRPVLYAIVAMLVIANTINIAADISAMGDVVARLVGGPRLVYDVAIGSACLLLQMLMPYQRYVRYLKWLTLALLAYVAMLFAVDVAWLDVLRGLAWPSLAFDGPMLTTVVAVLGTTISPYLFFWQAAQEVEDIRADRRAKALVKVPAQARAELRRIRIDTYVGMAFSNPIAVAIMVTTAATLHRAGVAEIRTSVDAAEALRPLAGDFAFLLFALGIIGTGLLAVPVLAGSAAYAVAETFHWRAGLDLPPEKGREFYGIIAFATIGGASLGFTPVDPIRALYWSAVLNGVVAVPIMIVMMRAVGEARVMGPFVASPRLRLLGWLATWTMAAAVAAMFIVR
jgi:NRAMP (natural resistance-associated macrophage protein)-like metal ion transporter